MYQSTSIPHVRLPDFDCSTSHDTSSLRSLRSSLLGSLVWGGLLVFGRVCQKQPLRLWRNLKMDVI